MNGRWGQERILFLTGEITMWKKGKLIDVDDKENHY